MDCNRDEAARSKSIAEQKFMQKDYAGAKKFALKARQLFPDLEGLVQFIAVVEVHAIAQGKLQCGEKDWYGILQSDFTADEASLRRQYRRLALILHPDKNKFPGAESAFKYVSEAWTILSDKREKAAYDSRRQPPAAKPVPAKRPGRSFQTKRPEKVVSRKESSQTKRSEKVPPQKEQAQKTPSTGFQPQESPAPIYSSSSELTFWTSCPDCKLQYEYHIIYQNKKLCCPFCLKAFLAKELPVVVNGSMIWPPLSKEQNQNDVAGRDGLSSVNGYCQRDVRSKAPTASSSFSHQETSHVNANTRKDDAKGNCGGRTESDPSRLTEELSKTEGDLKKSNCDVRTESDPSFANKHAAEDQRVSINKTSDDGCEVVDNAHPLGSSPTFAADVISTHLGKESHEMYTTSVDLESRLRLSPSKKARVDCQGLEDCFQKSPFQTDHEENIETFMVPDSKASNHDCANAADSHNTYNQDVEMNCSVSHTSFHLFDNDRSESHLASGQVWACYDDDDGFPRYYARIAKIISNMPLKVQYTWLEARSSSEEVMSWLDSGFSYTCGEFKPGKTLTGDSMDMFSHIMMFEKGQNGGLTIYPRKGEVWALYKDWFSLTTKDQKHGYELAEVLTDFSVECGVQLCLLVKVEGFMSVFQQCSDGVVHKVLPNELRRFSHNIPVYRLDNKVPDCIAGCLELDPASLPRT